LSKSWLFIVVLFNAFCGYTQDEKKETWAKEKDFLKYERRKDFKGPDDWYGGSPASMKDRR